MTKVVHCRRHKYDVYIGRPSKWGNPFIIGPDGTREEVLFKYRQYLSINFPLLMEIKKELKGKVLGCYCAPLPCHGDLLAKLADTGCPDCFGIGQINTDVQYNEDGSTKAVLWKECTTCQGKGYFNGEA